MWGGPGLKLWNINKGIIDRNWILKVLESSFKGSERILTSTSLTGPWREDGCLAEDDIPAEETPMALRQDSENQDNTIYRNIIH